MADLVLIMTMSLDGFFCGPGGELDWMTQVPDPEFSRDNVASFDRGRGAPPPSFILVSAWSMDRR